jgi:hypothetical protein
LPLRCRRVQIAAIVSIRGVLSTGRAILTVSARGTTDQTSPSDDNSGHDAARTEKQIARVGES